MISNYAKVAVRSMKRDKLQSLISVFSLSVGISTGVLILLFARHEMTSDSFHNEVQDVYRVHRVEHRVNGPLKQSSGVSVPLGQTMLDEMLDIKAMTRARPGSVQIVHDGVRVEESVLFVDPGFFEVFSFNMLSESIASPLRREDGMVLSRSVAERFFGTENAVGQALDIWLSGELRSVIVEAVVEDAPSNSSIEYAILLPIQVWPSFDREQDQWVNFNVATYFRIHPESQIDRVQQQLDALVQTRFAEAREMFQSSGWWQNREDALQLVALPLEEVHFASQISPMVASTGSTAGLRILMSVALAVLLLACINFMTLTVGRSTRRALEVGIRKTFGAHRSQLARQFWGEALLMSAISLTIGIALVFLLLPQFNRLADTGISWSTFDLTLGLQVIALTLAAGFVAGGYPAVVLSRFRPSSVLKGQRLGRMNWWFSRSMVVVQFTVSIGMIAATIVIFNQIQFVKSSDLGFTDEEVVLLSLPSDPGEADIALDRLRTEFSRQSMVVNVSASSFGMANGGMRQVITQEDNQMIVYSSRVDANYVETMDLKLVAGRNLSEDYATDTELAVLINETFANQLNFDDPVGELLPEYEAEGVRIVGIVEDYHFQSLRSEIEPMLLHMSPSMGQYAFAMVRIQTDQLSHAMQTVQDAWTIVAPNQPFVAEFMDDRLDQLYRQEERWGQIFSYAAFMAVILACLGLFGLATLTVRQRLQEIGIRKVMGATTQNILGLVTREFMVLVVVAFFLATPITWMLVQQWLSGFAYHVEIGPMVFIWTAALVGLVALLTVAGQSWKAALIHPARILQNQG